MSLKKTESRAERVRTILGARAIFNNGRSALDCQIRNISSTGARISLAESLSLPATFDLEVPSRNRTYQVAIRWRTKDSAGVQFTDRSSHDVAAAAEEIEALRSENALLRRRVTDLVRKLSELGYSDWNR